MCSIYSKFSSFEEKQKLTSKFLVNALQHEFVMMMLVLTCILVLLLLLFSLLKLIYTIYTKNFACQEFFTKRLLQIMTNYGSFAIIGVVKKQQSDNFLTHGLLEVSKLRHFVPFLHHFGAIYPYPCTILVHSLVFPKVIMLYFYNMTLRILP